MAQSKEQREKVFKDLPAEGLAKVKIAGVIYDGKKGDHYNTNVIYLSLEGEEKGYLDSTRNKYVSFGPEGNDFQNIDNVKPEIFPIKEKDSEKDQDPPKE